MQAPRLENCAIVQHRPASRNNRPDHSIGLPFQAGRIDAAGNSTAPGVSRNVSAFDDGNRIQNRP